MTGNVVELVPDEISGQLKEALEQLLGYAESGEAVGIAFVVNLSNGKYWCNTAGRARRHPTKTAGAVGILWHVLCARILERD